MTGWRKRTIEMAQEPVVCKHEWFRTGAMEQTEFRCIKCGVWNNTTPSQRTWVGLTDEQRMCSERTTADAYAYADADAYKEGCKVGRAEAFEQIAEKVKEMPWENDTRDSFLIWLKEQR